MNQTILIVGKTGQVGWELCRELSPLGRVLAVDYPEIDLANADSIRAVVRDANPGVIVNAAAYTAVDKAEAEPETAMKINGLAPGIMAEEARKTGSLLVHYSTDYVYDGIKSGPYVEEDVPNPLNTYGRTKLAGDQAVQAVGGAFLVFRLCWIYGARGHNFLRTIMRLAREQEVLRVVSDQVGAPTWCRNVATATALALQRVRAASDSGAFSGVYHLASSGRTSWHGFASAIVNSMPETERKCREVVPIPSSAYPAAALRPRNSALECAKLRRVFGLVLPSWEEALPMVLEEKAGSRFSKSAPPEQGCSC